MARHYLQAAKTGKADTAPLITALEQAKLKQREAEIAHRKHIEEHGCVLSDMTHAGL